MATKKRKEKTNATSTIIKSLKSNAKPKTNPIFVIKTRIGTKDEQGNEILFGHPFKVDVDVIKSYFKEKIIINDGIVHADPGIYTWVMIANEDNSYVDFYAANTISMQELGSLHKNIVDAMGQEASFVVAAGELKKTEHKITFNLLSGTYMEPMGRGKSNEEKQHVKKTAHSIAHARFRAFGINQPEYTNENILAKENIRTPPEIIELLNRLFTRKQKPANAP